MTAILYKLRRSRAAEAVRALRAVALRATTKPVFVASLRRDVPLSFYADGERPTFFGYHDKTPFSVDGSKVLAMSIAASDTRPESECTQMQIGYFDANVPEPDFVRVASTTTWSWQQGCMLQWSPASPEHQIIFNDMVEGSYGALLYDCVRGGVVRTFDAPIYSLDPTARFASSLNFSRLGRLRPGYGYGVLPDRSASERAPNDDGLFLIDLSSGRKHLLVSLRELAGGDGGEFDHYINHATFSPDGRYLAFFHLWSKGALSSMRLCAADVLSGKLVEIERERLVSHYCWRDAGEILATTREPSGKWHYTFYELDNPARRDLNVALKTDGHPMFHPQDRDVVVTDTYPDRRRDQHLCILNVRTSTVEEVATLYSPLAYRGQVRCDLHPRWDRSGRYVAVDTTARGTRELALVRIGAG